MSHVHSRVVISQCVLLCLCFCMLGTNTILNNIRASKNQHIPPNTFLLKEKNVSPQARALFPPQDTPRPVQYPKASLEAPLNDSAFTLIDHPEASVKVLVGIFCNAQRYDEDRKLRDAYRTTLKKFAIRYKFFFGSLPENDIMLENNIHRDLLVGDFAENVNEGKSLRWFQYASTREPVDYVIKMDQDTVVDWAKLLSLLELNANPPVYFGNRVVSWGLDLSVSPVPSVAAPSNQCQIFGRDGCWFYMSGGFYGLSFDLVLQVSNCPFAMQNTGAPEDAVTGTWLLNCAANVHTLDIPFGFAHYHYYLDKSDMAHKIMQQSLRPSPKTGSGTVTAFLAGRLGNHLFIAASSFGVALSKGAQWCIPNLEGSMLEKAVIFHVPPGNCNPEGVDVMDENGGFLVFHPGMMHGSQSVLIRTYLQSFRYFTASGLPFELRTMGYGEQWVKDRGVRIGIHVRRTDQFAGHGAKDPGIDYFAAALHMLQYSGSHAVVCTDDPEWIRSHALFDGMHLCNGSPEEDMGVLASCPDLIMSVGTFGWWAGYLRSFKGRTIYYPTPFLRELDYHEHFPAHWTPVSDHDIEQFRFTHQTCNVTLVTSYFAINSKHSVDEYKQWMPNMLSLDACMAVYAPGAWKDEILGHRRGRPTHFVPVELNDAALRLNRTEAFWASQVGLDVEAHLHKGWELYWVWALKAVFLRDEVLKNVFKSSHFFWMDIGCMRDGKYSGRALQSVPPQVEDHPSSVFFTKVPLSPAGDYSLAGAMWGGSASAVLRFHDAYFRVFNARADQGAFVGKDQTLFDLACLQNAGLCVQIQPDASVYDIWFFTLPFLLGDVPDNIPTLMTPEPSVERVLITTMLTDSVDSYHRGALALMSSIRKDLSFMTQSRQFDFCILELDYKPIQDPGIRQALEYAGWTLKTVPHIPPRAGTDTFPRFIDQFSKLNVWNMIQYDRILYMDSDCLVVGTLEELLSIELGDSLWVTRDISGGRWVSGFNMGVFMIRPSQQEFHRLIRDKDDPSVVFDTMMSEQGFLNVVYANRWRDFGFRNNANLAAFSDDHDLWVKQEEAGLNIIHYTMSKPWGCEDRYAQVCQSWNHFSSVAARGPEFYTTLVTALYDIKRHDRAFEDYRSWTAQTLEIRMPMIVFSAPEDLTWIREARERALSGSFIPTLYVPEREIPLANLVQDVKTILSDMQLANSHNGAIEWLNELYIPLQFSKAVWLQKAMETNPFKSSNFFWIDAGLSRFFQDGQPQSRFRLLERANLSADRIYVTATEYFQDLDSKTPDEIIGTQRNYLMGTVFGGNAGPLLKVCNELVDVLRSDMIQQNRLDNEQIGLSVVYLKHKDLFEPLDAAGMGCHVVCK